MLQESFHILWLDNLPSSLPSTSWLLPPLFPSRCSLTGEQLNVSAFRYCYHTGTPALHSVHFIHKFQQPQSDEMLPRFSYIVSYSGTSSLQRPLNYKNSWGWFCTFQSSYGSALTLWFPFSATGLIWKRYFHKLQPSFHLKMDQAKQTFNMHVYIQT